LTPKKSSQKTANITYSVDEVSNSEIKVTVTNNSNQKANIRLLVIFMKDGQVYGFNRKAKFEVEANGSSVQDITMPYDKYYVYLTGCLE
jgi:archaellum component FlaF (FlaF/FlaG flagellin family)